MEIKNIIFDFGGVLLNLDYKRSYDALSEVMGVELQHDDIPEELLPIFIDFETGAINDETFIWRLQKASKGYPQAREVIDAWNAMLLGWNHERLDMLLDLQKHYEVFLLSNTNSIHLDWVYKDLEKNHGVHAFDKKYFDKTYYSHQIGLRKPDIDIYKYVLSDAGILARETIFIDDNQENVAAASSVGIKAIHHDPDQEIMNKIDEYIQ